MTRNIPTIILLWLLAYAQYSFSEIGIPEQFDWGTQNVMPSKPGQILVKTFQHSQLGALDSILTTINGVVVQDFPMVPNLSLIQFDEVFNVNEVVDLFMSDPNVEYAEPDYYYHAATLDPLFAQQWALENNGQTGGTRDSDINANSMWAINSGSPSVVVGVIDSGTDYNHPDLIPNLWRNLLDLPGTGIDEDGNGYVDDVYGLNAITNTGNPYDDNSHGTHVAGTIGAKGNNSVGVVGVAQNVQIATCKFLGANGSGATSDAIQCLQYFADLKTRALSPVNIVATNNSWSGSAKSFALSDAIVAHQNLGILFVAAAGNDTVNNDLINSFPANYNLANVISVAATDHKDLLASFSNYGRRTVHVAAPGVRILSTVPGQAYALFSGTSMATPHVTGLIAIIKSRFPTLDYRNVKNLVIASGTPLASLATKTISGRRIRGADVNGRGALTCANQTVTSRLAPMLSSIGTLLGQPLFLSAIRINCSIPAGSLTLYTDSLQTVTLQDNGLNGDVTANDGVYSLLWQPTIPGNYALNFGAGDIVTVSVATGSQPPVYQVFNVPYSYEVITGTALSVEDETVHTVTAPFPIKFNGSLSGYTSLYVTSNGTISVTDNVNPGYINSTLPTNAVNSLIAPYWDDLTPTSGTSDVFVATIGAAPNRKFVVEWRNIRHYNVNGTATFQAVFFENSSDVRFNYQDTNFGSVNFNSGRSATVGIQSSPTSARQFGFNVATVSSFTSLLFRI
jgi:subtilisin family serine protease